MTSRRIIIVAINWQKVLKEEPCSIERAHYIKCLNKYEGEDIAEFIQHFDDYEDGWRVYVFSRIKQADELVQNTLKQPRELE